MINVKAILIHRNAFNVIQITIENKILMEIFLENAYVRMAIMTILKMLYANNALFNFGIIILYFFH